MKGFVKIIAGMVCIVVVVIMNGCGKTAKQTTEDSTSDWVIDWNAKVGQPSKLTEEEERLVLQDFTEKLEALYPGRTFQLKAGETDINKGMRSIYIYGVCDQDEVSFSFTGYGGRDTRRYLESYQKARWKKEFREEIEKFFSQMYGEENYFVKTSGTGFSTQGEVYGDNPGLDISWQYVDEKFFNQSYLETLEYLKENLDYSSTFVQVFVFGDDFVKAEEALKVHQLLEKYVFCIKNKAEIQWENYTHHYRLYGIEIVYIDKEHQEIIIEEDISGANPYVKENTLLYFEKRYNQDTPDFWPDSKGEYLLPYFE